MKPSIGRIVIYHPLPNNEDFCSPNAVDQPAVIVAVWSDTCVNLKVLTDGPHDVWVTSVVEGKEARHWSWPEIQR